LLVALEGEGSPSTGGAQARWDRYRAAFERVGDRVARVIVFVRPNEAEVLVDGKSLGKRVSGRYFAVLPGQHTWTARLDGYQTDEVTHSVRAGDMPDVTLALRERGVERAMKPPPARGQPDLGAACDADCEERIGLKLRRDLEHWVRHRMEPTLALTAGGLLSAGFTADVGPGFWVGGEARWGAPDGVGFSVGIEVRTLLPTQGGVRSNGKPMDISLVTAGIAPCVRYRWGMGCAVVDAGVSIAGGPPPLSFPQGSCLAMLGVGPRLAIDLPIFGPLAARAFADLRFSPLDTGYVNQGAPTWRSPLVSGLFGVGVAFR